MGACVHRKNCICGLLKKYADFRSDYKIGLIQLATSLQPYHNLSGIVRYYGDFVDIVDDWHSLFAQSIHLDLLVMYGGTWRYTFLKAIQELLLHPEGRLRAVLPELTPRSSLLQVYAKRLAVKPSDVLERVNVAIEDLKNLAHIGHVEIYTVPFYFYHACYLFDTGGVLALYSYKFARVSTPAFVLSDGECIHFLRSDFEWLVSDANHVRNVIHKPSSI